MDSSIRILRVGREELFRDKILKINWALTRRCNYDCSYCNVHNNNGKLHDFGKITNGVEKILKMKRDFFRFTFTGGEPTIHPDYLNIVEFCLSSNPNTNVGTITNLSRTLKFYQDYVSRLGKYKDRVWIKSSYHFEFAKLERFLSNAKFLLENGITTTISILAHPNHMDEVFTLHNELQKLQTNKLILEIILVRENYGSEPDKRYSEKDLKFLLDKYDTKVANAIDIEYLKDGQHIKEKINLPEIVGRKLNQYKGMYCNAGLNMLSVDEEGKVTPAVCFRQFPSELNIYNPDLDLEVFNNPIVCPFESCSCLADLQIPKYTEKYMSSRSSKINALEAYKKIQSKKYD